MTGPARSPRAARGARVLLAVALATAAGAAEAQGYNPGVTYTLPNFASSPNLRKFVDSLPGVGAPGCVVGAVAGQVSCNENNLGQYIPLAQPDQASYPGSDFYAIGLRAFHQQLHSDLPATALRGYYQLNGVEHGSHYLGPLIIAQRNRPVRLLFQNSLPLSNDATNPEAPFGDLPLPVDTTIMGAGLGPNGGTALYTQNRATVHLHGGLTPWISDGTPHQWITPAGDPTPYQKGASFQNVPDMIGPNAPAGAGIPAPAPGDGLATFYYPNQQSARLMFYHDHAYGITRLNVLDGEAAGYLLTDPVEEDLISGLNATGNGLPKVLPDLGGVYHYGIPLVIQDRTFVNDVTTQAAQQPLPAGYARTPLTAAVDPNWRWGPGGSFWMPHEYMPNEDLVNPTGTNPLGRWDYGPWMIPPMVVQNPVLPSPTLIPEAYGDTALVNGTAYPYVTLPPIAVRFRVLNACNDRTLNLQLYYAATASGVPCDGATLDPATGALPPQGACTEVSMVPAIPRAAYPTWPSDGREGGVPDPARAGPDLIQIGNESGFLVQPAVWRSQPVDFDYNRRSVTFGGVTSHALLLMSGVRADVVVDLSSAAPGATLILYNDAPAPMPLFDSRNDYFTDDPDRSAVGGAPRTAPGFGPNTRTLLQIRIDPAGTPAAPYDVTALTAAMARAYGIDQDPPLVPQTVYNAAFPGIAATTVYAKGWDEALNVSGTTQSVAMVVTTVPGVGYATPPTVVFSGGGGAGAAATAALNGVTAITLVTAGSGYTSAPTVTIGAPGAGGIQATAAATVSGGVVTSIVVVNPGSNYTVAPAVTLAGGGGAGATATASIVLGSVGAITLTNTGSGYTSAPLVTLTGGGGTGAAAAAMLAGSIVMDGKNMVEGFDMMFGRMNAVLGSTPNPLTPTVGAGPVIGPMFYVDPPTELLKSGQTVLWRLTHVGVDSHAMHFHLLNVQVVNRVDWTNVIKPPYPDELGWKETIRTNPFEDIIVAIRPAAMTLPFAVPNSSRLLDPTTVAGSTANFTPAPPPPGFPQVAGITNVVTGFGWEYVWHCHLLGHEENDMMRPLVFQPTPPSASVAPAALAFGTVLVGTAAAPLVETVTNAAPAGSQSLVLSGITLTGANAADFTSTHTCAGGVGPLLSCAITVTFTPAAAGARRATLTLATNDPARPTVAIPLTGTGLVPPVAPTGLTAAIASATSATLSWRDASNNEAAFAIWRADNGGAAAQVGTVTRTAAQGTATGGLVTFTDAGLAAGNDYTYHVTATNAVGASPPSSTVTLAFAVPAAPTALAARVASATSAALSWTDASTSETSFAVWQSTNGGAFAQVATVTRTAAQGAATGGAVASTSAGLAAGSTYAFYVTAINALGASAPSATVSLTFAAPGAPTGFTGTVAAGATTDPLTLTWVAPTTGAGSYQIQRARNATFTTGLATTTVTGTLTTTTVNVAKGVSLYVRIRAVNAFGSSAWVNLTPFPIVTP